MQLKRVVITGLGAVTPLGNDVETFWSNLKNGVSGIQRIESFDVSAYDSRIAGEVRGFDPKPYFNNAKDPGMQTRTGNPAPIVQVVDELPKTASEKVQTRFLVEALGAPGAVVIETSGVDLRDRLERVSRHA